MAGAATTAIATFVPHFAVTLAGVRPESASQRITALALVAGGAAAVVLGMTTLPRSLAAAGAAAMTRRPRDHRDARPRARSQPAGTPSSDRDRSPTWWHWPSLPRGVALGGLVAAGVDPVLRCLGDAPPTHAWLTLFGAVSLTIFGTLVYLAPTILGARIRPSGWLIAGAAGLIGGPLVAATGFALGTAPLAVAGTVLTLVGAIGQMGYVVDTVRRRGPSPPSTIGVGLRSGTWSPDPAGSRLPLRSCSRSSSGAGR